MDPRADAVTGPSGSSLKTSPLIEVDLVWVADSIEGSGGSERMPRLERRVLALPFGTTIGAALAGAAPAPLLQALSEGRLSIAVFGERRGPGTCLRDGDRIELLGPLFADPKQSRLRRAQVQRARNGDSRWQKR